MELDFLRFFDACDPSRVLVMQRPEDRQYYVDFAEVRGGKVIESIERTILMRSHRGESTCQLFTGHIGCGKSTELRRLQDDLEQHGFHVIYFESAQDLDMADVDITDILLAIAHYVSSNLEKDAGIRLKPTYFENLFEEITDLLKTPLEFSGNFEFSLPLGLGKIMAQTKESPKTRGRLRQFLEPQTSNILDSLNKDVLEKAIEQLKNQGKKGLVVLVDSLDRVDNRLNSVGRPQPEYLFIDRGEQLRKLNCHLVYTIPLSLTFSNDYQMMTNRFGGGVLPKTLPMVPVWLKNGSPCEAGLSLLKRLVMARAFPHEGLEKRLELVPLVFDEPSTLDRLCQISGGHVRNLLGMLYSCLQEEDPPISRSTLEQVIQVYRDQLKIAISDNEWELLRRVQQKKSISGEDDYQILLRSLFVFEYHSEEGRWFDLNPLIV